jgi:hypothetical protein
VASELVCPLGTVLDLTAQRCVRPTTLKPDNKCYQKPKSAPALKNKHLSIKFNCTASGAASLGATTTNVQYTSTGTELSAERVLALDKVCKPANESVSMGYTFNFPLKDAPATDMPWGVKVFGFLSGAITSYTIRVNTYNATGALLNTYVQSPTWPTKATMDLFRW